MITLWAKELPWSSNLLVFVIIYIVLSASRAVLTSGAQNPELRFECETTISSATPAIPNIKLGSPIEEPPSNGKIPQWVEEEKQLGLWIGKKNSLDNQSVTNDITHWNLKLRFHRSWAINGVIAQLNKPLIYNVAILSWSSTDCIHSSGYKLHSASKVCLHWNCRSSTECISTFVIYAVYVRSVHAHYWKWVSAPLYLWA